MPAVPGVPAVPAVPTVPDLVLVPQVGQGGRGQIPKANTPRGASENVFVWQESTESRITAVVGKNKNVLLKPIFLQLSFFFFALAVLQTTAKKVF